VEEIPELFVIWQEIPQNRKPLVISGVQLMHLHSNKPARPTERNQAAVL
jgi:hypothetical protein